MVLRIHPVVGHNVSIGMTHHVLHQHIDIVPQMNPPELSVGFFRWRQLAEVCKRHLPELLGVC